MGQTFQVHKDFTLDRISIYAGDGLGYDDDRSIVLGLYDLGSVSGQAGDKSYSVKENLFDQGNGLKIAYEVQAAGQIHFDLKGDNQIKLKAEYLYVFELKGKKGYLSMGWRREGLTHSMKALHTTTVQSLCRTIVTAIYLSSVAVTPSIMHWRFMG